MDNLPIDIELIRIIDLHLLLRGQNKKISCFKEIITSYFYYKMQTLKKERI